MTSYNEEQYSGNYPPGIENHFWISARNGIIYDKLVNAGMTGDKLLDVGCGRGIVVGYLRRRGLDCYGIELATPSLSGNLALYISTGLDAAALAAPLRDSIRGILLLDVIEHIDDAPAFLRGLAAAFPNTRRFLITVPAYPSLWSAWDEHYGHFRRYTPETLCQAILAAGLRPAKLCSFFHSLYVPMRLMSLAKMKRRTAEKAPVNPALHGLIAGFFRWEARLLPCFLPGTSLAIVADAGQMRSSE